MLLRLYLRTREDAHGLCDIVIIYRIDEKEVYFSTGRKVNKDHWNAKALSEWVKPSYGGAANTLNMLLKKMLDEAEEKMNRFYLTNDRYPSREEMKLMMSNKSVEKSFFGLFDQFMLDRKNSITTGTYKNYKKTKKRFEEYQTHNKVPFGFHSINHGFYTHFTNYLVREHESKVNTIGSYFRILKAFLHYCEIHHQVNIDKAVMATIHIVNEQNFYVSLVKEEIDKLAALDFGEHKPLLTRSRDAFVLQCCLGCRYGDLQRTMTENIVLDGDSYMFRFKTRKNQKLIQVPLSRRAIAIIDKYKGVSAADWIPTLGECNIHIKDICKLAGFYEVVQLVRGAGDNRKEFRFQKWQLVTTHSARRTFINTMLADGINEHVVAAMTGQSIKTIQGYKHADTRDIQKAITQWDRPAPESKEAGAPRQVE